MVGKKESLGRRLLEEMDMMMVWWRWTKRNENEEQQDQGDKEGRGKIGESALKFRFWKS